MNPQLIRLKLKEEQRRLVALQYRQNGVRQFYEACLMEGYTEEADRHRVEMHELVDMQLDAVASCSLLMRSLMDASSDDDS